MCLYSLAASLDPSCKDAYCRNKIWLKLYLQISKDLIPINKELQKYVEQWDKHVDSWLVIKVNDPAYVFTWRQQAEQAMKAAGKAGMTDDQVPFSLRLEFFAIPST